MSLDLAAIKARCAAVRAMRARTESDLLDIACHYAVDIPALVAEVERLRRVEAAAAEYVTMTIEYDGSDAWAAGNAKLKAALRAAESGE